MNLEEHVTGGAPQGKDLPCGLHGMHGVTRGKGSKVKLLRVERMAFRKYSEHLLARERTVLRSYLFDRLRGHDLATVLGKDSTGAVYHEVYSARKHLLKVSREQAGNSTPPEAPSEKPSLPL